MGSEQPSGHKLQSDQPQPCQLDRSIYIDAFTFLKCFIGDILSVVSVKELTIITSYKTEQYNTESVSFDCFVGGVGVVNLN